MTDAEQIATRAIYAALSELAKREIVLLGIGGKIDASQAERDAAFAEWQFLTEIAMPALRGALDKINPVVFPAGAANGESWWQSLKRVAFGM